MNLAELLAKLAKLKTEASAILDLTEREARAPTAEEESRYQELEAEIEKVSAEVASARAARDRRARLAQIADSTGAPPASGAPGFEGPRGHGITTNERDPARTHGFANLAEFASAVRAATPGGGNVAHADERLTGPLRRTFLPDGTVAAPTNFHQGQGGDEGYLIPPEFRDAIWEIAVEASELLPLVDMEPTARNSFEYSADEDTPWGATGIQAKWRSEGAAMTATEVGLDPRVMRLHELYAFASATEELLEDRPRLENRLTTKAGQAIGWKVADSFIWGTGAGQPLGFMNAAALVTVAKEGSQSADTIAAANLLKMYARLLAVPGSMPRWVGNRSIIPQLAAMTIGDSPVWLPGNSMTSAPHGTILGYPLLLTEHAPGIGELGDITLADFKGYHAAQKTGGVKFAVSIHLFFDYNTTAFRWVFRIGGQPHLSAPVAGAKTGSQTKSHFVTLAERA